jgi:hypothetical protein
MLRGHLPLLSKELIDGKTMQSFIAATTEGDGWNAGFQNGEVERANMSVEQVGGAEVCGLMLKALVVPGAAC